MNTNRLLFIIIMVVTAAKNLPAQTPAYFNPDHRTPATINGYTLVWNDEFNVDGKPDTTKWRYEHGFVRNEELQWYQNDNASCRNGVLIIEGRRQKIGNPTYDPGAKEWRTARRFAEFTSASIQTRGHNQWKYGHFEIRAKIDTSKGAWPAIWTLGTSGAWPANGEIDIMEFYRVKEEPTILANVAWGSNQPGTASWHTETIPLAHFLDKDRDWPKKFHVWKMDWNKDSINIYLDDELLHATATNTTINADGSNPFNQPQFLLLNMALGGNGGKPSFKNTIRYEVDYVRVYQKNR